MLPYMKACQRTLTAWFECAADDLAREASESKYQLLLVCLLRPTTLCLSLSLWRHINYSWSCINPLIKVVFSSFSAWVYFATVNLLFALNIWLLFYKWIVILLIKFRRFTDLHLVYHWNVFFYVLLTVHLSIILVINQLNAQNLVL